MIKKFFIFFIALSVALTTFASDKFSLTPVGENNAARVYTLYNGARIYLNGVIYEISTGDDGRITFIDPASGKNYGPFQAVNGRIMRIGNKTYSFNTESVSDQKITQTEEAPIATFDPLPPIPEKLEVTEEKKRSVRAKVLTDLPSAQRPFEVSAFFSPTDITPIEWSANSGKANNTDIERSTFGTTFSYNSWFADLTLSSDIKGGQILPSSIAVSDCIADGGSGWSVGIGYKRPFLKENNWIASAGLYGKIRKDELDISYTALRNTGFADTNIFGNVEYENKSYKGTIEVTEKILRVDLELAYVAFNYSFYVACLIQPYSDISVSGTLSGVGDGISLSAKHNDPIAVKFGGTVFLNKGFKIFSDLTLGYETRLRIGIGKNF